VKGSVLIIASIALIYAKPLITYSLKCRKPN